MDSGPCRALRPKWFYNSTSNQCERFFWGGCKGNQNRFNTENECQSSCLVRVVSVRSAKADDVSPLLPPITPKCEQNGQSFNLGDVIKFGSDMCQSCSCNSPPNLTCTKKACPPEPPLPSSDNVRCKHTFDDDGCCAVGFQCVSANPPMIRRPPQNEEQEK